MLATVASMVTLSDPGETVFRAKDGKVVTRADLRQLALASLAHLAAEP
jgi:hypothetical protein